MSPDAPAPDFGPDAAGLMRRIDTTKAHPARAYDVFLGGVASIGEATDDDIDVYVTVARKG